MCTLNISIAHLSLDTKKIHSTLDILIDINISTRSPNIYFSQFAFDLPQRLPNFRNCFTRPSEIKFDDAEKSKTKKKKKPASSRARAERKRDRAKRRKKKFIFARASDKVERATRLVDKRKAKQIKSI